MKNPGAYRVAVIALLASADPGRAQAPPSRAEAVVAASKQATGGSAWDELQGCYEEGTYAGGGIAYRTWFRLTGYGIRVESRSDGVTRTIGFNGNASWRTDGAGGVDVRTDADGLREAITTAYLSSNGFFFPERFRASFGYARQAEHGGRSFDVVEITPAGGRPLDYWFDRDTHFLGRVVDRRGTMPVTVEAGDYRRAGNVAVAFSLDMIGPDGAIANRGVLTALSCGPVDAALFDPPAAR